MLSFLLSSIIKYNIPINFQKLSMFLIIIITLDIQFTMDDYRTFEISYHILSIVKILNKC